MKTRFGKGDPRNILVIRLRGIGDVILTLPAISALRAAYPGASIDYLCEPPQDQVLRDLTDLNHVHLLRRGDLGPGETPTSLLRRIRRRYDLVVDLSSSTWSSFLAGFSGAPTRLGARGFPWSLLFNIHSPEAEQVVSDLQRHLNTLEPVIGRRAVHLPRLQASVAEREAGRRMLEDRGLGEGSVAILPGAARPSREWPENYFVRLAAQIRMDGRYRPFFLGQPGQRARLERIRVLSNSQVVILPELELRPLMGLLSSSRALVCAEGGILHLGVALGVPTLALFGPTDPAARFPYEHAPNAELLVHAAECRPCHRNTCDDPFCMEEITPEIAFERLEALIARTEPD